MASPKRKLKDLILRYRRGLILVYHAFAVTMACLIAFYLRFDGKVPAEYLPVIPYTVALFLVIRLSLFNLFGLYRGLWRYAGMADLQKILASVTLGSLLFAVLVYGSGYTSFPRSVVVMEWLLIVGMIGGVRFALRSYKDFKHSKAKEGEKVLVIGAGNAGEMLVRDMKNNPFYLYDPVGFVDDDYRKKGLTIHGVPILGTREDLPAIVKEYAPEAFLLAIPSAKPGTMQELMKELSEYKVPIKTLPNLKDILDGNVSVSQIRRLDLEDLLARPPVKTDTRKVLEFIQGKTVMVTGAGGSIGSEICKQVLAVGAGTVIAYERHENSLYELDKDIRRSMPGDGFYAVVGDINDKQRLEETLARFLPDIIFHAAAHKHVPLMEENPREAIKNNVLGTRRVALLAGEYGVGAFVMVSTDKAVNPTSIMGASKRACELVVRGLNESSETKYITVRFGNVLGSSGSVVPLFREQIRRGGPVTVTHPDITRFLMLIPEAVQLVLQAASIGNGGEIFVLDMGEPIRIADLARDLIVLSGFEPEKDIKIEYIGLRPGEKLYEELFDKDEEVVLTSAGKVFKAASRDLPDRAAIVDFCDRLEQRLVLKDTNGMVGLLCEIVKSYVPQFEPSQPEPRPNRRA